MLTIYCSNCGGKSSYSLKKPKFCGECSLPFESSISHVKPTIQKPIHRASVEDNEEEFTELPDIKNIAIELSIPEATNNLKWFRDEDRQTARRRLAGRLGSQLNNVIGTNEGHNPEVRRTIDTKRSEKEVLDELRKESISNRNSEDVN